MLRYSDYQICLNEIPDEISLGISILGCNVHCKDCHSKHLWDINSKDKGEELTPLRLLSFIKRKPIITCVLFLGGEWDSDALVTLCKTVRDTNNLKLALYTGRGLNEITDLIKNFDYLKIGPYRKSHGDLTYPTTNQRLYRITENGKILTNITNKFWRNK